MSRDHSKREKSIDWIVFARTMSFVILGVILVGLIVAIQANLVYSLEWGWIGFLAVLHLLLVVLSEKALTGLVPVLKLRLRLAFLVSFVLVISGLFLLLIQAQFENSVLRTSLPWMMAILYVVIAFCTSFAGGLLVTHLHMPLWENNLPPTEELCTDVLNRHRCVEIIAEGFPVRFFDLGLSMMGLIFSSPVWIMCLFLIWFEDPGPVLFIKNSVGKGGVNFRQLKLRTMVYNAEEGTGPVLSPEYDERVLKSGKLLRKTALDELPQLVNILKSEMSFVGPRPQRTVLVSEYLKTIPEYAERHGVLPGLAGLAQVAGDYYLTPRQKLRFDNLYIQNKSLLLNLKLLLLAFLIAFWFRWQKDWNGRLPRPLLHSASK